MIHHTFYRGKKIIVIMRDGKKIIGKYKDSWSKGIILEGNKRIPYIKIKANASTALETELSKQQGFNIKNEEERLEKGEKAGMALLNLINNDSDTESGVLTHQISALL